MPGFNGGLDAVGFGMQAPGGAVQKPVSQVLYTYFRDVSAGSRSKAKPDGTTLINGTALSAIAAGRSYDIWMRVTVVGGGGGGKTAYLGGAGGGCACQDWVLAADIAYTVGLGGTGGSTPTDGGQSTAAWGSYSLIANGGQNGSVGSALGGTASGGTWNFQGGGNDGYYAGGGAAGPGGAGNGNYTANNGLPGGGQKGDVYYNSGSYVGGGGGGTAAAGGWYLYDGGYSTHSPGTYPATGIWGKSATWTTAPTYVASDGGEMGGGGGAGNGITGMSGGVGGFVAEYMIIFY